MADKKTPRRHFEDWWPHLASVGIASVASYAMQSMSWPMTFDAIVSGAMTISAMMAGLIAAVLSVLLAVRESPQVKILEASGHFTLLVKRARTALLWSVAATLACMAMLWLEGCGTTAVGGRPIRCFPVVFATLLCLAGMLTSSGRILHLMFKLLLR